MSEVSIVNMALMRIGVTQTIADMGERSKEALIARTFYAQTRDELLRAFPWSFARKRVRLSLSADPAIDDWLFSYVYPTDCLKVIKIEPDGGSRYSTAGIVAEADYLMGRYNPALGAMRIPYEVASNADGNGRLICTDIEDASMAYIARIEDTGSFDALFTSTLAWRLAYEFAMPMAVDANLRTDAWNNYMAMMQTAMAQNMNEAQDDRPPESPSIRVRA